MRANRTKSVKYGTPYIMNRNKNQQVPTSRYAEVSVINFSFKCNGEVCAATRTEISRDKA